MTLWPPLAWTAFVLLPIDGWAVVDGVPIGVLEAAVLGAIWYAWAVTRQLGGAKIAAAALIFKVAATLLVVPTGFRASYFANDRFDPPMERSVEYRGTDATRIDRRLAFGSEGRPDFPLFFFDDFRRFNFYQRGEPRRYELPFSVVWDGYVWEAEGDRSRRIYLQGSAVGARLEIDGATVVELAPGAGIASTTVLYPRGWRHIVVRLTAANGVARDFEAGMGEAPLGSAPVYRQRASRNALLVDRTVRGAGAIVDAILLVLLTVSVVRAAMRPTLIRVAAAVAIVEALWFAAPAAGRLILQPGGDDSLTYQTYARDIVLHGPWMLLGAAPGQAEPFYYQPLYPYFLALVHLVCGDDLFGVYLLQRLSLAIVAGAVWWMAHTLYGAGRAGAIIAIAFLYGWVDPWARTLWTEVLFVALTAVWTCWLVRLCRPEAGPRTAVVAGLVGGAAVLTRSTLLLGLAIVPPILVMGRRRARARWSPVIVMLVVAAAVISLATLRNWVASGRLVPITTSFGINLYLGNAPGSRLPVHDDHAIYQWITTDLNTAQVIEFMLHEPGPFAANLRNKALYAFGYYEWLVPGAGYSPVLILTWLAALAGAPRAARTAPPVPLSTMARLVPAAIASSLFASVILIFPSHFRLILPGYVMLLPYVAALAAWPWRRV